MPGPAPSCVPLCADGLAPIRKRIICIGGFTQARHGRTGMEKVWQRLRQEHEAAVNGTRVSIHPWNDDWRELVGHILRTGPQDPHQLDVRIVAYSWGVGHGAVTLARELRHEGIAVQRLASCDGVYYSRLMPWRAIWSGINYALGQPKITIPSNVRIAEYIRQQTDLPAGHQLKAEAPDKTMILTRGFATPGVGHADIDNSDAFLQMALDACV